MPESESESEGENCFILLLAVILEIVAPGCFLLLLLGELFNFHSENPVLFLFLIVAGCSYASKIIFTSGMLFCHVSFKKGGKIPNNLDIFLKKTLQKKLNLKNLNFLKLI